MVFAPFFKGVEKQLCLCGQCIEAEVAFISTVPGGISKKARWLLSK
jgi:hypothetical protein